MFKIKVFIFISLIKNSFCPCGKDRRMNEFEKSETQYKIEKIATLPSVINESSGIVMINDSVFWTINDGGGKSELYEVDRKGTLQSVIKIPNSTNVDWEEITLDKKGTIYIGDFGNNDNTRKDLCIYKYNPLNQTTERIDFSYLDQHTFPPEKKNKNFDCEAMFHLNDSLYLVSKNRGNKMVRFYKMPDKAGVYQLLPFYTTYVNSMITGASIDYKNEKIALLSYGKFYLLDIEQGESLHLKMISCVRFARNAQAEGIAYGKNDVLFVTNEQGTVFKISPKK